MEPPSPPAASAAEAPAGVHGGGRRAEADAEAGGGGEACGGKGAAGACQNQRPGSLPPPRKAGDAAGPGHGEWTPQDPRGGMSQLLGQMTFLRGRF